MEKLRTERTESETALFQGTWLHRIKHPFADLALSHLFPLNLETGKILPQRFTVEIPWRETSEAFRKNLTELLLPMEARLLTDPNAGLSHSRFGLPEPIPPPPKGIIGRLASSAGRDILTAWLLQVEPLLSNGRGVSIPERIRDPAHRAAVETALRKLIPEPRLTAGPETQRGSGFLGTEADWDTWLLIADLQERAGLSRLKAEFHAAWKRFDAESYEECTETERLAPESETEAEAIHERNAHHITRSRQAIDAAIKSVYPSFRMFG